MKQIQVLFTVMLAIAMTNCQSCLKKTARYRFTIQNDASLTLKYSISTLGQGPPLYPDTSLPFSNSVLLEIKPNKSVIVDLGHQPFEDYFADLPSDTLSIYLYNADTIAAYTWDQMRQAYKVVKRYDVSLKNLKELNYRINYPPSAQMKGMKMFPR